MSTTTLLNQLSRNGAGKQDRLQWNVRKMSRNVSRHPEKASGAAIAALLMVYVRGGDWKKIGRKNRRIKQTAPNITGSMLEKFDFQGDNEEMDQISTKLQRPSDCTNYAENDGNDFLTCDLQEIFRKNWAFFGCKNLKICKK